MCGLVALQPGSASASPAAKPSCTITGTPGKDILRGTSGDDVICGLGGDDIVYGLGGDDVLRGGPGDDHLAGGAGNDQLIGGAGDDNLVAGETRWIAWTFRNFSDTDIHAKLSSDSCLDKYELHIPAGGYDRYLLQVSPDGPRCKQIASVTFTGINGSTFSADVSWTSISCSWGRGKPPCEWTDINNTLSAPAGTVFYAIQFA